VRFAGSRCIGICLISSRTNRHTLSWAAKFLDERKKNKNTKVIQDVNTETTGHGVRRTFREPRIPPRRNVRTGSNAVRLGILRSRVRAPRVSFRSRRKTATTVVRPPVRAAVEEKRSRAEFSIGKCARSRQRDRTRSIPRNTRRARACMVRGNGCGGAGTTARERESVRE